MKKSLILSSTLIILFCFICYFILNNSSSSMSHQTKDTMENISSNLKDKKPWVKFTDSQGNVIAEVFVELAITQYETARGLMYRKQLPQNHGMLFMLREEKEHFFYMKNTLIPLDMIFINSDMKVAGIIENARPLKEDTLTVGEVSKYVLEVNAFFAKQNRIQKEHKVIFSSDIEK